MIAIFLTILAGVVYILLFAICTYVLIYYQHPDDNATAFLPKVVVVTSLSLAIASVLMLPLDAASQKMIDTGENEGIPLEVLWYTVFIAEACLVVIIIPFSYFYYSAYDPDKGKGECLRAVKYLVFFFLGFGILTTVLYFLIGTAEVPLYYQTSLFQPYDTLPFDVRAQETPYQFNSTIMERPFQVSFILFLISILAALGGLLFTLFGGIGLTLLPADLIQEYKNRPKPITDQEFNARKILLGERADELIKEGVNYRTKRASRTQYNEWKQDVFLLEEEFDLTMAAHKRDFPVFLYWGLLILGVLGIGFSITWIIQILIWKIYEFDPLLNTLFNILDDQLWAFFGVVAVCIWSLWLLWCTAKGTFAFGLRVPFLFSVHPMKPEGTLMSGFLFNAGMIVLSSVSIVQFCAESFNNYLRMTPVIQIFSVAVSNLMVLKWFWRVYTWALMGFAVLAIIVIFWRRKKRRVKRIQLAHINTKRINDKGTGKSGKKKKS